MEYYCQSYKRNELSGHRMAWENLKCTLLSKGKLSEYLDIILYDFVYITFQEKERSKEALKR